MVKRRAEIYREAREALIQIEGTTVWSAGEITLRLLELGLLILLGTAAGKTLLINPPLPEDQEERPVVH
jgi:hypothetical protein